MGVLYYNPFSNSIARFDHTSVEEDHYGASLLTKDELQAWEPTSVAVPHVRSARAAMCSTAIF
jgi:hypothetical protein